MSLVLYDKSQILLHPDIRGTVSTRVAYLVGQRGTVWLSAKVHVEVPVQGQATHLCVHIHTQEEGPVPTVGVVLVGHVQMNFLIIHSIQIAKSHTHYHNNIILARTK